MKDGTISVEAQAEVYAINGSLVARINGGVVRGLVPGVYIVVVNGKAVRVVL